MHWLHSRRRKLRQGSFLLVLLSIVLPLPSTGLARSDGPMKTSDIEIAAIHRIVGGGTTPEAVAYPGVRGLHKIQTRRLRLINVDTNLKGITADGNLDIEWSQHLKAGLQLCKKNGWVPRIIIGQMVPPSLSMERVGGGKYGPSSWALYDKYIAAFLAYVTDEWGFKESEWEVGNEMNIPSQNWIALKQPTGPLDMVGFSAYMTLYTHVAKTVKTFKLEHPQSIVRVGGPAISPPGYLEENERQNWVLRFVDEIAVRQLPCDFISVHAYGNEGTGAETFHALTKIKQRMALRQINAPISISEWGASWLSDREINLDPIAGAFVFEFSRLMSQAKVTDAIFLALSEFRDQKWPVLYTSEGMPTHAMKAMQLLSSLNGTVLPCETGLAKAYCLAVKTSTNDIHILVWYLDWWNDQIGTAKGLKSEAKVVVNFSKLESAQYAGSSARISTHSSNITCPCPLGVVITEGPSAVQLPAVNFGYGDYALLIFSAAK